MDALSPTKLASEAWHIWEWVRKMSPLVQCITNDVAMDITANVLLAAGASPAMVSSTDEAEHFASHAASALLVNLGTLRSDAVAAQRLAMQAATLAGKPVVLDPVACGATPYRTSACVRALELRPTVVRGNAGEVLALAAASGAWVEESGSAGGPLVRGVDSAVSSGDARVLAAAKAIARRYGCVVAVSGEVDLVLAFSESRLRGYAVRNGVEMLTRVTAAGCSMTALVAAFAAAGTRCGVGPALSVAAALSVFGACAEAALERAGRKGPGSLRAGLLDELYLMTEDEFKRLAKIQELESATLLP